MSTIIQYNTDYNVRLGATTLKSVDLDFDRPAAAIAAAFDSMANDNKFPDRRVSISVPPEAYVARSAPVASRYALSQRAKKIGSGGIAIALAALWALTIYLGYKAGALEGMSRGNCTHH